MTIGIKDKKPKRIAEIEKLLAEPMPQQERIPLEQELARLKPEPPPTAVVPPVYPTKPKVELAEDLPEIFRRVYPEEEISPEVMSFMLQWAEEDPISFLQDIMDKGRTPATESLLRAFGAEEEDIEEVFTPVPITPAEELITAVFTGMKVEEVVDLATTDFNAFLEEMRIGGRTKEKQDLLKMMGLDWEAIAKVFETQKVVLDIEGVRKLVTIMPDNSVLDDKGREIGRVNPANLEFEPYKYRIGDTWKSFSAGTGDVIVTSGGALKWLGAEGIGERLSEFGEYLQLQAPPDTLGEFNWQHLYNPRFYSERVVRTLPFTLALVPAWIAGASAGTTIAGVAGLGRFWTFVLQATGAATLSRPIESALEAGGTYDEALAKGMSPEEARQAANEVFLNNLKLVGVDAAQLAVAFAPTPARVFERLITKGLVTTTRIAGKVTITGLSEAGEEYYQEIIQRQALGEEIVWDAEMKEVVAIGGIMGLGLGVGGDVFTTIQRRTREALSPEQKGLPLDELIGQPEVQQMVKDVIENIKIDEIEKEIRPKTEVDKIVWERTFEQMREEAPPVPVIPEEVAPPAVEGVKPQVFMTQEMWDEMPTRAKEKAAVESGLERIVGYKTWDKLTLAEKYALGVKEAKAPPQITRAERVGLEMGEKEAEVAGLKEWLETEPATKLVSLIKRTGWYKGEVSNLTVKQYRNLTHKTPLANILTKDKKHIRWEYALDDIATEMGYESGDALKEAIERTGEALFDIRVLERDIRMAEAPFEKLKPFEVFEAETWKPHLRLESPLSEDQTATILSLGKQKLIVSENNVPKPQLANLMKGLVGKNKINQLTEDEADTIIIALDMLEVKYGKPPKIPTGVGLITKEFADKIPYLKEIGILEKVRPTRQVFEKMGLRKEVFEPAFKAEVAIYEELQAFRKEARETEKLVGKDPERRRLVFRELENPGSVVGLTFSERRAVAWFRKYFDDWADKLNLPQEKRRENYVTHIFEAEIKQELDTKHPLDPELIKALDFITPKTIFNPYLQKRLGQTIGLKEDPFAAVSAYEARALKVYHYEPLIQKIRVYEKYLPPHSSRYLRNFITRITGRPLTIDRELNQTLGEFAEKISVLPGGKQLADYMTRGNFGGMTAYQFTSGLYFLWLGFKPTSAIRNLSQHTLALAEVGPINFAEGMRLRLTKEGKAALKESLVLRSRRQAFIPGIDASFASQWTDKFRETALWMFRQADRQNVSDSFLAGYAEMKRNFPEAGKEWWVKRGDEVAADTQYIYSQMGSAAWSQSAIGRFLSVLTTWPENWVELMTRFVKGRPSYVMNEYAESVGTTVPKKNWLLARKAMLLYMAIVAMGFVIKEETRLKAWEYTGLTSLRYLADLAGGEFPALQYPGAVADLIVGFLTDDERMFKTGWANLKPVNLMGIVRSLDNVVSGEKDWMTLLFYLEGKDYKIKQLKDRWEKDFKPYGELEPKDRAEYRENNPKIEAKLFITGQFTTLSTEEARQEVLRLIEEHKLDIELIDGYEKVFGVDTGVELDKFQNRVGNLEKLEVGVEAEYFTMNDFASEVNRLEKNMGRYKIEKDGNQLAIEYLRAKDQWEAYYDLDNEGRKLYRQQFPELEAQLYLWGKISAFENPKSAVELLRLMKKYDIPPEGVKAFVDDPAKFDELQTPLFELKLKFSDMEEGGPQYEPTRRRIEGMEKGIPEVHLDPYVEYYSLPVEGYDQERLLKDNEAYYNDVWLGILGNEPKDFDKIPSVEVERSIDEYEELPTIGKDRLIYRHEHPDFEKWLVEQKGYTPVGDRWEEKEEPKPTPKPEPKPEPKPAPKPKKVEPEKVGLEESREEMERKLKELIK